jgi:ABC-2 type transport system ATP-binding protein
MVEPGISNTSPAIDALDVEYRYGEHVALDRFALQVNQGEMFALLGPNGSGKTTFFKLLTTLKTPRAGRLAVFGHELPIASAQVRRMLGVVFQHASCDAKLTVRENLQCQAALFGLRGDERRSRIEQVANELGFTDRLDWMLEKLSGGLQRRVDIAKSMLHAPRLLILDEPSTGLDPAARLDLWHALVQLRDAYGVTIVMTTHLLEEAEKAERIGILHAGRMVAVGPPAELRRQLGGRVLIIETTQSERVLQWLAERSITADTQLDQVRVSGAQVAELVAPLTAQFGDSLKRLSIAEPSLEDVFIARTGHRFWNSDANADTVESQSKRRGNKRSFGRSSR